MKVLLVAVGWCIGIVIVSFITNEWSGKINTMFHLIAMSLWIEYLIKKVWNKTST